MNESQKKHHMMVVAAVCLRQPVYLCGLHQVVSEHVNIYLFHVFFLFVKFSLFAIDRLEHVTVAYFTLFCTPFSNLLSTLLITVSICFFFFIHVPKNAKPFHDKHLSISSNIHLITQFCSINVNNCVCDKWLNHFMNNSTRWIVVFRKCTIRKAHEL